MIVMGRKPEIKKVIPCLDVKDGRVVKGINFIGLRDAGDPVEFAAAYAAGGADEVVFLDITATTEGRKTTIEMAARAKGKILVPYAVGGGFRDLEGIRQMLDAGADKVSINTAAFKDPLLLTKASLVFGSQAIISAIDVAQVSRISDASPIDAWTVLINGGTVDTEVDVVTWAQKVAKLGAGEILLTSMDRDGTKDGFDLALTRAVARAVDIPVTASGGAGTLEHFAQGIIEGEADAVLGASVFHFGELTIREVKEYLAAQGISVRL